MTTSPYSRSVELFDTLMQAPRSASHDTPASLIQAANIPSTTGYRHVAALEAEGFLRRDPTGVYLRGAAAIRTGFNGFGLGKVSPLAQPILLRLRQATQHTAFLAIVRDLDLHLGPYSVGRETRGLELQPVYGFETIPDLTKAEPTVTTLRSQDGQIIRRTSALLSPVSETQDAFAVLGLLLNPGWERSDHLPPLLSSACEQITDALEEN